MKVVERQAKDIFRFRCKHCDRILEATGDEFEFVKKGRLAYNCPVCKETRVIREGSVQVVPVYK